MKEEIYSIALGCALGAGARTDEIYAYYPSARAVFEDSRQGRAISGVFTPSQLRKIEEYPIEKAAGHFDICAKNGWQVIDYSNDFYPRLLRRIPNFPPVLYVQGNLSFINKKVPVAIVGTRNPSADSVRCAMTISADCARAGAVVISGGALGIDSAAHEGALAAEGLTVAVLGSGLGVNYLMKNESLRRRIGERGALVTEYPPFTPASKSTFPLRNRLISGMSLGVLVVEAGENSGSLITAARAREQGRDVFAMPGSASSEAFNGANTLIFDGAKPVINASQLLEQYAFLYPGRLFTDRITGEGVLPPKEEKTEAPAPVKKPQKSKEDVPVTKPLSPLPEGISEGARKIYSLLGENPLHPDELGVLAGMKSGDVTAALIELELEGAIRSHSGKLYSK